MSNISLAIGFTGLIPRFPPLIANVPDGRRGLTLVRGLLGSGIKI